MLYTEINTDIWPEARERGRELIDAGFFSPIREDGLIVGVEPTEALLDLFEGTPPTDRLFDAMARFSKYHLLFANSPLMTQACDDLLALGMRKGESGTIWKALRFRPVVS